MAERAKRQRLKPEVRREKLLEAATEVFAERGYESARVEQIADVAQVSPGLLYRHFEGKQELYEELLLLANRQLLEHLAQAAAPNLPTDQRVLRGLDAFFGIVRWKVKTGKPAFSADPADWSKAKFLTDIDTSGKGVIDAEVSPNGKQLALVSNLGSSFYRLWLADDPEDFALSSAKPTAVRACKVTWRGDSKDLLIVSADAICREDVASVVRVNPASVRDQKELNPTGDDPSFQPLTIGG